MSNKRKPSELEVESAEQNLEVSELAPISKPEPTVKVRGVSNHKCRIGNNDIIIEKDKETRLTSCEAMILQGAGKVFILA